MAHPNLVEILAHLDFLLEGHVWRSLPDRGIIHMHKMLVDLADKLGGGYTVDQIRERLWQEFQHGYKYPEHNFPQLFLHGSSEMQNLDPKTRKLVEERLIVIRLNAAFHAPRSLRSKSVATTSVALPNIDTRNTSTPTPPSAKSSKRNRRTSSVQKNAPRKKNMPSKVRLDIVLN
ncbi:hypothetical protein K504DRAFT_38289 [Pleomassaria siparia CBS 279.74]|uniref:Uncharacterized protein n=1 Tax=Pleomassaria siparia CBS 279.74 TaxID=1314801 RepID=A0A6G1K3V2_9PLEO|nr:hypothetical protein K504DRAFT_38289 [Pleomassaria siparia CBS 279.74]